MRLVPLLLAVAVVVAGVPSVPDYQAKAWGAFGHLTVCDLAYRNLTPATRAQLGQLFGNGITIPTSDRQDGRTYTAFNVGCLEEDALPRKHKKDHFINVDRSLSAISGATCPVGASGQPGDCVLSGIQRDLSILKDTTKTRQERVIALMAIGHWVGDIHQPLHISYADDAGGNSIGVTFQGFCGTAPSGSRYRPDSLHAIWDNCLLQSGLFQRVRERADFKPTWSYRTITYRAVDSIQANTTLAQEQDYVRTAPWQWAAESYSITRQSGVQYCTMVGSKCQFAANQGLNRDGGPERTVVIGAPYLDAYKDIATDRVTRAGYRLAHLINLALDPAYQMPAE